MTDETSKTIGSSVSTLDSKKADESSLRPKFKGHGYQTDEYGRPLPGSYSPWSKLKYRYQDHRSHKA